jgi:hypothetical protein
MRLLKRTASTLKRQLPAVLPAYDLATDALAADRARGAAAALRRLKCNIMAPHRGSWDKVVAALRQDVIVLATANCGGMPGSSHRPNRSSACPLDDPARCGYATPRSHSPTAIDRLPWPPSHKIATKPRGKPVAWSTTYLVRLHNRPRYELSYRCPAPQLICRARSDRLVPSGRTVR